MSAFAGTLIVAAARREVRSNFEFFMIFLSVFLNFEKGRKIMRRGRAKARDARERDATKAAENCFCGS